MFALQKQPILYSPFAPARNPAADRVHQQNLIWGQKFGLIRTREEYQRVDRGRFGDLMGRAYPNASPEALQIIADWNAWMFLLDDQFDERALGRAPDAMEHIHARILAILEGDAAYESDAQHLHALWDVARRLREQRDAAWMQRFTTCVREAFAASLWESRNRQLGLVPTEADYRYWRPFGGGVFCYFTLIEVAEEMVLPPVVRDHSVIRELTQRANHVICWANDIVSLPKELARGDVHNLVYVTHRERQWTLDDAVSYVAEQHDAEVRAFELAATRVPRFGGVTDQLVQRYVSALTTWMRANMDWSCVTYRYPQN